MKPYCVDLRQKIIDAYKQQDGSQRQLAKRFRVSLSFIENLLKRYRTDGTVEPRAHGGGQMAKLGRALQKCGSAKLNKVSPPVNYPLIKQPVRGTTTAATDR